MQRFPVARYVAASVVVWGVVLAATAGTRDFAGIVAVRFFLGALEGAVTAGGWRLLSDLDDAEMLTGA